MKFKNDFARTSSPTLKSSKKRDNIAKKGTKKPGTEINPSRAFLLGEQKIRRSRNFKTLFPVLTLVK